jgi:Uma2 family endonuclease
MTAAELLYLSLPDKRTELVRGRLIVREPAGGRHGAVANLLAYRLTAHVETARAGRVYAAETGFTIGRDPDTVRAPDVAFVSAARLPATEPAGFLDGAPDLAVEVLSHPDRPGEVLQKVADWLTAGARLVWVVDTERGTARVYRADGTETLLGADGILGGEEVLPGFLCPLRELSFAA